MSKRQCLADSSVNVVCEDSSEDSLEEVLGNLDERVLHVEGVVDELAKIVSRIEGILAQSRSERISGGVTKIQTPSS